MQLTNRLQYKILTVMELKLWVKAKLNFAIRNRINNLEID